MEEFKEGDVVELKSGGPKMTIKTIYDDDGSIHCQWFAEAGQEAIFKSYELKKEKV